MSQFGGNKNAPWSRNSNQGNSLQQQIMNQSLGNMNASGMVQFQQQHQQQVFQNALGLQQQNLGLGLQQMANSVGAAQLATNQIFQQVSAVTYPNPRALNPNAFQTQAISAVPPVQNNNNNPGTKQRVFTGTVTKVHDNFGFVDEEVFFQTNACVKGSNPMVGDRVLVEASFNPSMPFKWNATRIQVLPISSQVSGRQSGGSKNYSGSGGYNAVPPPLENSNGNFGRGSQRPKASMQRNRDRSRDRDRDDDDIDRKRRREERLREREKEDKKSPVRRRSRSPKTRRRSRIVPRYMVQVPKISLNLPKADVLDIRRRYGNLYIPSDFFFTNFRWIDAFPPDKPFTMNKPCAFHIFNKDVEPLCENDAVLEPPDADYIFSAKVMLMSIPGLEEIYTKCCAMAEDKSKRDRESEDKDYIHPARLINFLVGLRGKNETMAIGGAWSKSLDGENPDKDPSVLIKTAIRTCKALTGIDLSNCTQWYRFVELYYRRSESTHKGKVVPPRVETVVLFLPDVWSCLPTRLEWDTLHQNYRKQLERKLNADQESGADSETPTADEKEEEAIPDKPEPTHHSQLDPKTMNVNQLRTELKARSLNTKGLKQQLVARLSKTLKSEAEKNTEKTTEKSEETEKTKEVVDSESDTPEEHKKEVEEKEKKIDEKERAILEKRYALPEQPFLLVHPSKTAKSGKFDCTTMSLSLLLDYRPEDTKEHSFEVSLFAEMFNEMLMRDFGFNIFRALHDLPDKTKEKEEKKKNDDKKTEDKKKEDDKKKDDKKDDGKQKGEKRKAEDELKKEDKRKNDDKKNEDDNKKDGEDKGKIDDKKKDDEKSDAKEKKDDKKNEESKEDKHENDRKKDNKKDDRKSDESDEDEEDEGSIKDRKKGDKRKRERVKMYTKDRHLLLSFVYFDQTHCGYIFDKDIEELLYTLGLSLSRAQVRKLVTKVVTRDSLHYRKLTDKPKDDDFIVIDDSEKDVNLHELAVGNKRLLPVFSDSVPSTKRAKMAGSEVDLKTNEGMVMFRGALVDVGKLISQLERSEKARIETEARMVDLKNENNKLTEKCNKSNSSIKHLNSEVRDYKEKLRSAEDSLTRVSAYSKIFQSTLHDIKEKIDPVLKSSFVKDEVKRENDKDKRHDEGWSRWEKEAKKEELAESKAAEVKEA